MRTRGPRPGFPEVDRAAWFGIDEAKRRILPAQAPLLDELARRVEGSPMTGPRTTPP